MDNIEIKFYKNDKEIEISEIPDEYISGIVCACRSELESRKRWEGVLGRAMNK